MSEEDNEIITRCVILCLVARARIKVEGAVIGMSTTLLLFSFLFLTVCVESVHKNGNDLSLWIDSQQVKMFSGMLYIKHRFPES